MSSVAYITEIAQFNKSLTTVQVLIASLVACLGFFHCAIKYLTRLTNKSARRLYDDLNVLCDSGILICDRVHTGVGTKYRNIYVCIFNSKGERRTLDEIEYLLNKGRTALINYYQGGGNDTALEELYSF